ncbi:methyl-CpG-binding domain-containing protein 6-like [Camellia sinensis]|uniref:methyl-CpG-binding domain-containing protein 6-like n=1 Tax=Camellia sinensis TaxID=4442 RepID=UPI0010357C9D|nr:methyl-CpG-binding domain-containing protein 6-like [Camellia sinensis]
MKPNNARTKKVTEGPPGWMVESRPRTNEKYLGKIDWFYYEPGTGKQYRSHSKAWARYYETQQQIVVFVPKEEETAHNPNMEFANMKDKTRRFNVGKMPDSVTWVLTDTEYNKWTTYIEDEMVLEDEQILWAETFEFAMVYKHWPDSKGIDMCPQP